MINITNDNEATEALNSFAYYMNRRADELKIAHEMVEHLEARLAARPPDVELRPIYNAIAVAVAKASLHGRYASLWEVWGVVAEEFDEFKVEVQKKDKARCREELLDIIGACVKAVEAIDAGLL